MRSVLVTSFPADSTRTAKIVNARFPSGTGSPPERSSRRARSTSHAPNSYTACRLCSAMRVNVAGEFIRGVLDSVLGVEPQQESARLAIPAAAERESNSLVVDSIEHVTNAQCRTRVNISAVTCLQGRRQRLDRS